MDWNRDKSPEGMPSLENMTTTAINILQRNSNGFVLVVSQTHDGGMKGAYIK